MSTLKSRVNMHLLGKRAPPYHRLPSGARMFFYVLITIATCSVACLYLKWLRVKSYWADRGVPYQPPNPILGSLTFLQRQNPGLWLRQLYNFKSPYVGMWLLWRPGLVINSPEIARRILVKDFGNFRNRYLSSGQSDPIGGLNLFTVNDPIWSSMRNRLSSVFTSAKLRILQDYVGLKAKELAQRIHNDKDNPINLKVTYVDFTTDVIGTSAFGVESNSTLTGKGSMREITHDFGKFGIMRGLSWCSIFFFPDFVDYFRFTFFPKESEDYLKRVFRMIVKNREENATDQKESKDLLDALIKIKKEKIENNEAVSDDLLIAQAAIFLLGGFETSGSVLSFITYEMAFNPELQVNTIKEGLRKYSPMGWLDRIAMMDYQIDDKVTIKAGTPVYVNSIGMHYDPDYFPDPEKFEPDRFLPQNEKDTKPYTYMPFGHGPRICIGQRFAQMTVRYALSSVFLNFKVYPVPNMPKPSDVKIDNRCLLYLAGEPLLVKFVPRH
ncbi:jg20814 [Pararge aegeria aegeria]|uniref:unspecific monooxygenase n=1 Tax=Pararge aegeria aegeria TaxID=348720 RepID=A0A8S4R7N8_9NEOP|nr:jg20814 [Pararge aegeria aegeria]